MPLFLMPFSGQAVGGGGPSERDPPPAGLDSPKDAAAKRRKIKPFDRTPPGQIPSAPPPYAWRPLERQDWRPGLSVVEDASGAITRDPLSARRAALHAEAAKLRQEIAKLRDEVQQALQASRQKAEIDRLKNAPSAGSPLSGSSTLPKLPRATRPFPMPKHEAWGAPPKLNVVAPGTPLHMRRGPMTLDPNTSRIVALRAQISSKRLRLAQIRSELKTITGKNPVFNTQLHPRPPQKASPVHKQAQGIQAVRHQWLGRPRQSPARSVASATQKLKSHGTQWTRKSPGQTEEHHPCFVSRRQGWRSQLKTSQ